MVEFKLGIPPNRVGEQYDRIFSDMIQQMNKHFNDFMQDLQSRAKEEKWLNEKDNKEMEYIRDRIGKFSISGDCLISNPDSVQEIFKRVIPIDVQYDHIHRIFNYKAISKDFDIIPNGWTIPEYIVTIDKDNKVEFTK